MQNLVWKSEILKAVDSAVSTAKLSLSSSAGAHETSALARNNISACLLLAADS